MQMHESTEAATPCSTWLLQGPMRPHAGCLTPWAQERPSLGSQPEAIGLQSPGTREHGIGGSIPAQLAETRLILYARSLHMTLQAAAGHHAARLSRTIGW